MNNETKIEANESIEEVVQSNELTENSKMGTLKKVGIGLCLTTAAAGIITFVVVKNKNRICDLMAKILKKNGFAVTKLTSNTSTEDAEALAEEWVKSQSPEDEDFVNIFDKEN